MDLTNTPLAVAMLLAIGFGALSFLSPCVLPLVPSYLGYMSGAAVQKGMVKAPRTALLAHAFTFVVGFTVVFVLVVGMGGELLKALFAQNWRNVIQWVGGTMMIIFGLHFLGVFNIPLLERTVRLDVRPNQNVGYLRSFLIGMGFAAGWTPCIGPFMSGLLALSQQRDVSAIPISVAYSLGLGIPFMLVALSTGQVMAALKKITRRTFNLTLGGRTLLRDLNLISMVSGILLIAVGVLLFSGQFTRLNALIAPLLPDWLQRI
jgi:cytochrome c-type biogenesis protein